MKITMRSVERKEQTLSLSKYEVERAIFDSLKEKAGLIPVGFTRENAIGWDDETHAAIVYVTDTKIETS